MEGAFNVKFIKNGAAPTLTRLPPGFRFQPTDEELLFQYLKRKIFSVTLPAYVIPEVNVWAYDPWNLPGGGQPNQEMQYFFSNSGPKCDNNSSGYWRDCGIVPQFFPSLEDPRIMGIKRSMVYHKIRMGFDSKTDWTMDVYSLVPSNNDIASRELRDLLEKWVVCGVGRKKTSNDSNVASNSNLSLMLDNDDDDDEIASSSSSSSSTAPDDVVSTPSSASARYSYFGYSN